MKLLYQYSKTDCSKFCFGFHTAKLYFTTAELIGEIE